MFLSFQKHPSTDSKEPIRQNCQPIGESEQNPVNRKDILSDSAAHWQFQRLTAVLLNSVSSNSAGTASGVLNTCRQLVGAMAVAVFGALIARQDTFVHGMQLSLMIAAILLIGTAAMSLQLRDSTSHA